MTFIAVWCVCIGMADAAVRDASTVSRATTPTTTQSTAPRTSQRTQTTTTRATASQTASRTTKNSVARTQQPQTTSRTTTTVARPAQHNTTAARTATSATSGRTATNTNATTARSASKNISRTATHTGSARNARAATISLADSQTFGTGYNACRDAYFTCMDQFCAKQNDKYRRCICSSRLTDIQNRERALAQASDQLQDFHDLNIEAIPKTAAEVKAMLNATDGEYAASIAKDKSASAQKLAGISEVLTSTKSKSLSTAGQLDIAGDINAIWATTDLTSGASIANLTGEALYNAVHSQCTELVSSSCQSQSTLNMVISAYGMYIENDCTTLSNTLDKKKTLANSTIRETEREMNTARLDNYNAHNSTPINDCIAQVRADITGNTACGPDYVRCLDISGKYLNRDTGEPIYTADFYQLETQISLSGDVLTNPANTLIIAELNRKRIFAERGLDTCRDLANEVWDEFMRQAITEIYQGQQNRIRQVKNECLAAVSECYDTQSTSLKDFSNINEQLLLGSRLELAEELCRKKLDACSNLYGGGPNGLQELVTAMRGITDQKIAKDCRTSLETFARDTCAVPGNDSLHSYPYACRVYAPGDQKYASVRTCNQELWNERNTVIPDTRVGYICPINRKYNKCKAGYFLTYNGIPNPNPQFGNACTKCVDALCSNNISDDAAVQCDDYIGSLYQKLVRYAMQVCIRPSAAEDQDAALPATVQQDVNVVMDKIRVDMRNSLSTECDRLGGYWVDVQWKDAKNNNTKTGTGDGIHDDTGHKLYDTFYNETGANTKWGYCANKETVHGITASTADNNAETE